MDVCLAVPPTGTGPNPLEAKAKAYMTGPNAGAPIVDAALFSYNVDIKTKPAAGKLYPGALGTVCCNPHRGFCGICAWIADSAPAPGGRGPLIVMGCINHP